MRHQSTLLLLMEHRCHWRQCIRCAWSWCPYSCCLRENPQSDTWPPMTSQEKSMWLFPELWKCFWAAGGIHSGLLFSSLQYLLSQKASANRFCSSVTQVSVDHRFKSDIRTWKKRANDLTHEQIVTPKQINPAKNKLILIELGPTDT